MAGVGDDCAVCDAGVTSLSDNGGVDVRVNSRTGFFLASRCYPSDGFVCPREPDSMLDGVPYWTFDPSGRGAQSRHGDNNNDSHSD